MAARDFLCRPRNHSDCCRPLGVAKRWLRRCSRHRVHDVPADVLEKEKKILMAEAGESGKPAEIVEKMVEGRMRKYLAEITLLGQPFVKNPDQTVEKLLKAEDAEAHFFARFEVGEGIEKKTENFAEEVMAQVKGE